MNSNILLIVLLFTSFVASKQYFGVQINATSGLDYPFYPKYFATLDGETGNITTVGLMTKAEGSVGLGKIDLIHNIYAVPLNLNGTDSTMFYTTIKQGTPSLTKTVTLPGYIYNHDFDLDKKRSIVMVVPNELSSTNATLYAVDLATFEATVVLQLEAPENVTFMFETGFTVDKDKVYIAAVDTESYSNGFLSYSLKTGRLSKQLFSNGLGTESLALMVKDNALYFNTVIGVFSVDLKSALINYIGADTCNGGGLLWDSSVGFDKEDNKSYQVWVDCNDIPIFTTTDLATGNVTVVQNQDLDSFTSPQSLRG